ncbi:MAG: DNA double-strand break repair nuclease NurA [Candidatus Heimdallarchaeaceae archaeon]
MRYSTFFDELKRFNTKEMPQIIKNIIKTEKELNNFINIVNCLKKEKIDFEQWITIAVDGGLGNVNLQGIGFVIATAHTYSSSLIELNELKETTDVRLISLPPTAENSLIGTLYMKALEYNVATQQLQLLCNNKKFEGISKLVLFDGSFSFPDKAFGRYGKDKELDKAFNEFENKFEGFIRKCLALKEKNHKIFIASISKDPRKPKYLEALKKNIMVKDANKANILEKQLERHKKQERTLISILSRVYSYSNQKGKYPIITEIQEINQFLKLDLPGDYFHSKKLYATYYQTRLDTVPFYIEIPELCFDIYKEGINVINYLSEISPVSGYPLPLVYVDVLARVSKKTASEIFKHLKKQFITRHPQYAQYIIQNEFRETLHQ